MNTREVQRALSELGFPLEIDGAFGRETFTAVKDFQRGFAFWTLLVDGHAGEKMHAALRYAVEEGGRCSEHFRFAEFRSKGNGWIKVHRELVLGLEAYRELVDGPVRIVSGYRDPNHNVRVGGAPSSQHLYGNAADLEPARATAEVARLKRFSGIGYQGSTGLVRHVDVRHIGPNTTRATLDAPTRWRYG